MNRESSRSGSAVPTVKSAGRQPGEVGVERRDVGDAPLLEAMVGQEVVREPRHAGIGENEWIDDEAAARRPAQVEGAVDQVRSAEGLRRSMSVAQAEDRHGSE